MYRRLVIVAVLFAIALAATSGLGIFSSPATETVAPAEATEEEREELIQFEDHESGVWPWLNAEPDFVKRSPINVVVQGDPDRVVRVFQQEARGEWQETPEDQREAREETFSARDVQINGTNVTWGESTGTSRYAYVHDGENGEWIREYQHLHDGTYYGERYHMRLYQSPHPEEDWVAIQAHSEHFDWFTLRHAVDGVQDAQVHVESDLRDSPAVEGLWREYVGNDGASNSDGWATMLSLSALFVLLGSVGVARRRTTDVCGPAANRSNDVEAASARASGGRSRTVVERQRERLQQFWETRLTPSDRERLAAVRNRLRFRLAVLALTIVGIVLGVRFAGIALELYVQRLTMHQIAGLLYPFLAIGVPVATYLISRTIDRRMDAGVAASLGMAAAILLDYQFVGVDVIPIEILLHRATLIFAIGLIAGGAAKHADRDGRFNGLVVGGALLWVALLLATLFQVI